jgi:hypothetical protein
MVASWAFPFRWGPSALGFKGDQGKKRKVRRVAVKAVFILEG